MYIYNIYICIGLFPLVCFPLFLTFGKYETSENRNVALVYYYDLIFWGQGQIKDPVDSCEGRHVHIWCRGLSVAQNQVVGCGCDTGEGRPVVHCMRSLAV